MLVKSLHEKEERTDDEILLFRWSVSQLLHTQITYICEYFCKLPGSIILSACLVLGIVASLAIIRVIHNHSKSKISFAIPQ